MAFLYCFNAYGFDTAHGKWWKSQKIVEQLELSDTQVNQIEEIFSSYKGRIVALDSELRDKERDFSQKVKNPNSTRQEISQLDGEVESIKGQLREIKIDMFLRIRDVLTPEQRSKLHEIKGSYDR